MKRETTTKRTATGYWQETVVPIGGSIFQSTVDVVGTGTDCCCKEHPCIIDQEDNQRPDNADINIGASTVWTGDTGSFSILGGTMVTTASNVSITPGSADLIIAHVFRTGATTTPSTVYVKLTDGAHPITGYVTFPATGGTAEVGLLGTYPLSTVTIPAPMVTNECTLTLCLVQYKDPDPDPTNGIIPLLGVHLYCDRGGLHLFGSIPSVSWDADTSTYGPAYFGTFAVGAGSTVGFIILQTEHGRGSVGGLWEHCQHCRSCPCVVCEDYTLLRDSSELISTLQCQWVIQSGNFSSTTWGSWAMTSSAYGFMHLEKPNICLVPYSSNGKLIVNIDTLTGNRCETSISPTDTDNAATPSGWVGRALSSIGLDHAYDRLWGDGVIVASVQTDMSLSGGTSLTIYGTDKFVLYQGPASDIMICTSGAAEFSPGWGSGQNPDTDIIGATSLQVQRYYSDQWPYCEKVTRQCLIFDSSTQYLWYRNRDYAIRELSGAVVASDPSAGALIYDDPGAAEWLYPHPTLSGGGFFNGLVGFTNTDMATPYGTDGLSAAITFGNDCKVRIRAYDPSVHTNEVVRYPLPDGSTSSLVVYDLVISGAVVASSEPMGTWFTTLAASPGDGSSIAVLVNICIGDGAIRVTNRASIDVITVAIQYDIAGPPYPGSGYWGFEFESQPTGTAVNPFRASCLGQLYYDSGSANDPRFSTVNLSTADGVVGCFHCVQNAGCSICPDLVMPKAIRLTLSGNADSNGTAGSTYDCDAGECESLDGVYFLYPERGVVSPPSGSYNHACIYNCIFPPVEKRGDGSNPCSAWFGEFRGGLVQVAGVPAWRFGLQGFYPGFSSSSAAAWQTTPGAGECTPATTFNVPWDSSLASLDGDTGASGVVTRCKFSGTTLTAELLY